MDRTVKKEHHLRLSQLCSRRPGLLRLIGFYRGFTRAFLLLLCGIGTLAMLFGGLYAVLQSGNADTQITGQALPQLQKEHSAYFSGTMIGQSLWLGSVHPNTFLLLRGNSTLQAPQADMGNVPMKQLIDETTLTDDDIYAFDRRCDRPADGRSSSGNTAPCSRTGRTVCACVAECTCSRRCSTNWH